MQLQQALSSFGGNLLSLTHHVHQTILSTAAAAGVPAATAEAGAISDSAREVLSSMRNTVSSVARDLVNDLRSTGSALVAPALPLLSMQPGQRQQQEPCTHILLLPEVMLHVFSYMDPEDALLAGPVCKSWHEAAKSPMLWTKKVCPTLASTCRCELFDPTLRLQHPSHTSRTGSHISSHPDLDHHTEGISNPAAPVDAHAAPEPADWASHEGLHNMGRPLTLPQLWLAFHHRNFLRNPGFQSLLNSNLNRPSWKKWRRNAWVFPTTGGDGIAWECPPVQCAPVPAAPKLFPAGLGAGGMAARAQQQLQGLLVGSEHGGGCVATSSDWNEVMQVVDFMEELQRRGLSQQQAEHVLDSGLPLGFSIYVGAHAEAGGQFSACMFLMEKEPEDVLNIAQRFVAKPSRYHFYSGKLKTTSPGQWQRFAHVVDSVPHGFRYGIVLLRAKDQASRKGHYGAKLACAQLTFLHESEKATFAKGDDHVAWTQRMQEAGLAAVPAGAAGGVAGGPPLGGAVDAVAAPAAPAVVPVVPGVVPAQPVEAY